MTLAPGPAAAALIRFFEGCGKRRADGKMQAYPDPATGGAPWTIGWGTTGTDVKPGVIWTQAQCDARFTTDTAYFASRVVRLLAGAPTTQHQFDAMLSFAYNVGLDENRNGIAEGLGDSTLLAMHKRGDFAGAQAQFSHWNHAGGKAVPGLTRRRAAEAALYGAPDNLPAPRLL